MCAAFVEADVSPIGSPPIRFQQPASIGYARRCAVTAEEIGGCVGEPAVVAELHDDAHCRWERSERLIEPPKVARHRGRKLEEDRSELAAQPSCVFEQKIDRRLRFLVDVGRG